MSIQDLMTADLDVFFSLDEFAESVTYTPAGGSSEGVEAIVQFQAILDDAKWKAALQATAVVYVRADSIVIIASARVSHGVVTNGPFVTGETVTGGSSGSTGKISNVGAGYIDVAEVTGPGFSPGETITISSKSAAVTVVSEIKTVVEPGYQDTLVIGSETWTVAKILGKSGGIWKLEIRTDLRPTFRKQ